MVAKIFLVMGEMIRADIKRAHAMDFGCSNHASAEHPKYVSLKSPGLTWTLELISGALEFFYPSHAQDILHSNKVFSLIKLIFFGIISGENSVGCFELTHRSDHLRCTGS